ncbi:hypothetical protein ACSU1N_03980 [Thermogladius sp. 4427co]
MAGGGRLGGIRFQTRLVVVGYGGSMACWLSLVQVTDFYYYVAG